MPTWIHLVTPPLPCSSPSLWTNAAFSRHFFPFLLTRQPLSRIIDKDDGFTASMFDPSLGATACSRIILTTTALSECNERVTMYRELERKRKWFSLFSRLKEKIG